MWRLAGTRSRDRPSEKAHNTEKFQRRNEHERREKDNRNSLLHRCNKRKYNMQTNNRGKMVREAKYRALRALAIHFHHHLCSNMFCHVEVVARCRFTCEEARRGSAFGHTKDRRERKIEEQNKGREGGKSEKAHNTEKFRYSTSTETK